MYKFSNNLVPDYISDIISSHVPEVSNYPLCNRVHFTNLYTRTETSRRSCIPSSVTCWNDLQSDIREVDTFLTFRHNLKDKVLISSNVPPFFVTGQRKLSVKHTRICNNCSDLKSDLFQNHLTDDKSCICGNNLTLSFLKWYKTCSCRFGSYENPLNRQ